MVINIGQDCWDIINDYKTQMEIVDKVDIFIENNKDNEEHIPHYIQFRKQIITFIYSLSKIIDYTFEEGTGSDIDEDISIDINLDLDNYIKNEEKINNIIKDYEVPYEERLMYSEYPLIYQNEWDDLKLYHIEL